MPNTSFFQGDSLKYFMDDLNRIGQPVSGFQHHAVKQQQKKLY